MSLTFKRPCPACGVEIVYSFPQGFYRARKHNRKCFKCSCNNEWKEKISKNLRGKTHSEILRGNPNYNKTCPSCGGIQYYSTKTKLNISIKENRKCFGCSRPKGKLFEDFRKECKSVHRDLYDYSMSHYENNELEIEIICPKHGSFWQKPRIHLHQKSGCPSCSRERLGKMLSSTTDEFIHKSKLVHGDKYDYSRVVYVDGNHKVEIVCPKHGSFFQVARTHMRRSGCPKCRMSKGELAIMKYLINAGKPYIYQHSLCKSPFGGTMRVDFFLSKENAVIEFDGEQHFKTGGHIGKHLFTDKEMRGIQLRDKLKNEYCQNNGIKLIRIPYWNLPRVNEILSTI